MSSTAFSSTAAGLHTLPMRANLPRGGPTELLPGRLFLGGMSDAMKKNSLEKAGIRLVINVAREVDNFHPKKFSYIKHALDDDEEETAMTHALMHQLANAIHRSIVERQEAVLVHCAGGISRSVSVCMAYFIKYGHLHPGTVEVGTATVDAASACSSSPSTSLTDGSSLAGATPSTAPAAAASDPPGASSSTGCPVPPSYESVFAYIQSRRRLICPNEGFVAALRTFHRALAHDGRRSPEEEVQADQVVLPSFVPPPANMQQQKKKKQQQQQQQSQQPQKVVKPLPNMQPATTLAPPGPLVSACSDADSTTTTLPSSTDDPSLIPSTLAGPPTAASLFAQLCERQAKAWMERGEPILTTTTTTTAMMIETEKIDGATAATAAVEENSTAPTAIPIASSSPPPALPTPTATSGASNPLISVIMPLHNAGAFLPATLVSLLHQTYRPMELCAYDDASTDGSIQVLDRFRPAFDQAGIPIRLRTSTELGQAAACGAGFARNRAIEQCSTESRFLMFQDADDLSLPERAWRQWEEWKRTKQEWVDQQQAKEEGEKQKMTTTTHTTTDVPQETLLPPILVGCHLERLPSDATPRWTRWINGMTRDQLVLHAFREITVPCPTWFTSRDTVDQPEAKQQRTLATTPESNPNLVVVEANQRAALTPADSNSDLAVKTNQVLVSATATPTVVSLERGRGVGVFQEVLGEDMHYFYSSLLASGCLLSQVPGDPLLVYRNHASNLSGRTPFAYLFQLRTRALEKLVLTSEAYPAFAHHAPFSIWNAGKAGKHFYRALSPASQSRVRAFCDIDPKKIERGVFHAHVPGQAEFKSVPIISWVDAVAPIIICVRQELAEDESQREFRHRIEVVKGWKEGVDYFYLS